MQWKLIPRISELGMGWDKLISYKTCAIMPYIITVKLFYHDQKIQECGMQWAVAIKKWIKIMRLKGVMLEPKAPKTEKE